MVSDIEIRFSVGSVTCINLSSRHVILKEHKSCWGLAYFIPRSRHWFETQSNFQCYVRHWLTAMCLPFLLLFRHLLNDDRTYWIFIWLLKFGQPYSVRYSSRVTTSSRESSRTAHNRIYWIIIGSRSQIHCLAMKLKLLILLIFIWIGQWITSKRVNVFAPRHVRCPKENLEETLNFEESRRSWRVTQNAVECEKEIVIWL